MTDTGMYFRVQRSDGRWDSVDVSQMTPAEIDQVKKMRPDWGKQIFDHLINWCKTYVQDLSYDDVLTLEHMDAGVQPYEAVKKIVAWMQAAIVRKS